MNEDILYSADLSKVQQRFMSNVYTWMAVALSITGLVAYMTASSNAAMNFFFANPFILIGILIAKLLMVGTLSIWVRKLSAVAATVVFMLYATLTGFVFSTLFLVYTSGSLASTFFITGGIFLIMSIYGYTTGNDLTKLGSLLFMLLIGLVLASIVNWFVASTTLDWIITYVGVFIFVGLIAVDTQKIKSWAGEMEEGSDDHRKYAVVGALSLYLDFINLFVFLLRIFGNRR